MRKWILLVMLACAQLVSAQSTGINMGRGEGIAYEKGVFGRKILTHKGNVFLLGNMLTSESRYYSVICSSLGAMNGFAKAKTVTHKIDEAAVCNDGDFTTDGKLLLGSTKGLKMLSMNADGSFKTIKTAPISRRKDVYSVVDLGDGKCAALACTFTKQHSGSEVWRTGLYFILWDYKKNVAKEFQISNHKFAPTSLLVPTRDGNVVLLADILKGENQQEELKSEAAFYESYTHVIKYDVQKSMTAEKEVKIWETQLNRIDDMRITDALEDVNGNIVFALKSSVGRGAYSEIGVGKVNSNGERFEGHKYDELDPSHYSGDCTFEDPHYGEPLSIRFADIGAPQLIEDPEKSGYILLYNQISTKVNCAKYGAFKKGGPTLYYVNRKYQIESVDEFVTRSASNYADDFIEPSIDMAYDKATKKIVVLQREDFPLETADNLGGVKSMAWAVNYSLDRAWKKGADYYTEDSSSEPAPQVSQTNEESTEDERPEGLWDGYVRLINETGEEIVLINEFGNNTTFYNGVRADVKCSQDFWIAESNSSGNKYTVKGRLVYEADSGCNQIVIIR